MNRPSILSPILAAALLALAADPGVARPTGAPSGPDSQEFVQRFDRDNDDRVSREEFPGSAEHFQALDSDGDGFVNAAEAPQGPPDGRHPRGLLQRMDTDADGQLSQEEWLAHFKQLDRNGDGFVNADELPGGRRRPAWHGK
jgi:hypothetical protein